MRFNFVKQIQNMRRTYFLIIFNLLMTTQLFTQFTAPTIILIHGGLPGGWCRNKILPVMEQKGLKVLPIDLPRHGDDKTPATTNTLNIKNSFSKRSKTLLYEITPINFFK